MIGRLVTMGAAVAAAAVGVAAATWAKRRAAEDAALEQEMLDTLEDHEEIISTPSVVADLASEVDAALETDDDGDDLTIVKGIGAVSAQRLSDAGVTRFAQLAAWSDKDLDRIAEEIKISSERIRREDWVGQAQTQTQTQTES
jgi:predicted flap endonuclease-1-like 5' DNA nuclease